MYNIYVVYGLTSHSYRNCCNTVCCWSHCYCRYCCYAAGDFFLHSLALRVEQVSQVYYYCYTNNQTTTATKKILFNVEWWQHTLHASSSANLANAKLLLQYSIIRIYDEFFYGSNLIHSFFGGPFIADHTRQMQKSTLRHSCQKCL